MLTELRQRFMELAPRNRLALIASVLAVLLILVVSVVALTSSDDDTVDAYIARSGINGKTKLRVGVFKDEYLMGHLANREDPNSTKIRDHDGFDVEIAAALAGYLGFSEDAVELIETQVQNRSRDLDDHTVDVVVASYSITPKREEEVDFAGPYLTSQPEVLMRADTAAARTGGLTMRELNDMGRKLCTIGSSTSDAALRAAEAHSFDGVGTSAECVNGLRSRKYDAFMLDDVVLAGFQYQYPNDLKIVDLVLDQKESYGIAVANGDEPLRTVVGNFLLDSYERGDSGAWERAWSKTLGKVLKHRAQPRPNEYKRLRDYRDRIQAGAPPGHQVGSDQPGQTDRSTFDGFAADARTTRRQSARSARQSVRRRTGRPGRGWLR